MQAAVVPLWGFWGALGANMVVTGSVTGLAACLVTRVLKRQR
jgi:hypothetical protein